MLKFSIILIGYFGMNIKLPRCKRQKDGDVKGSRSLIIEPFELSYVHNMCVFCGLFMF